MTQWPEGWDRDGRNPAAKAGSGGAASPRQAPAASPGRRLPPELDPRGGRSRPLPPELHPRGGRSRALPPELDPRGGRSRPQRPSPPPTGSTSALPAAPPSTPGGGGARIGAGSGGGRERRGGRIRPARVLLALLLVVALCYAGLAAWGLWRLQRVEALSGAAGTPGTTWLLIGSDSREELSDELADEIGTSTEGRRADTIMLFHVPGGGTAPTLVSLPRDSYVEIPGEGANKLNAAYSLGGPALLVETVEAETGMTVDHVADIGFGGFVGLTDAVGGVRLCPETDIVDERAHLDVRAGCQQMDGATSLGYVRARYSDPRGDLGRIERQQEYLGALFGRVFAPTTLLNPLAQVRLVAAATDALQVDEEVGVFGLARLAWEFRGVSGGGGTITTVPIADSDYRPGSIGSTVRWDDDGAAALFADLRAGREIPPVEPPN